MHCLALINQKGGCGKTTTAINLSAGLAERGHKVLLVDMDPQAHATLGLGVNPDFLIESVYDVFGTPGIEIREIAMSVSDRLDLAPSKFSLALIDRLVADRPEKHKALGRAIESCRSLYDFAIIDCPPNVGTLTLNALAACDEAMAVLETSFFSLHGISRLLDTLSAVRKTLNPDITVSVVATMYDKRTRFARDVLDEIRTHFGNKLYSSVIRTCVRLREAASAGLPIQSYDPKSRGGADYSALAEEVIERSLSAREAASRARVTAGVTAGTETSTRELHGTSETYLTPEHGDAPAGDEIENVAGVSTGGIDPQREGDPAQERGGAWQGSAREPEPLLAEMERCQEGFSGGVTPAESTGRGGGADVDETAAVESDRDEPLADAKAAEITAGEPVQIDGKVLFTLEAPDASDVRLTGDFNGWDPSATVMKRTDGAGIWAVEVELHDGRYEYRYLVDGDWMEDPENPLFVINEYGGKNSVIVLGETEDVETRVLDEESSGSGRSIDQPHAPHVT